MFSKIVLSGCLGMVLCSGAFASTRSPLSFEAGAGTGYRQDSIQFAFSRADLVPSIQAFIVKMDPIRGIPIWGFAEANLRNFIVRGEGDYTWIIGGKTKFNVPIPVNEGVSAESLPDIFSAKNRGHIYDVLGSGGYRIVFYDSPQTTFYLTPRGGYGIHRYRIHFRDVSPEVNHIDTSGTPLSGVAFNVSLDPKNMRINWWGPFVAADLGLRFCEKFRFTATYAYHWLDMQFRQSPFLNLDVSSPFFSFFARLTKILRPDITKAWSQEVQGTFSYLVNSDWTVTLFGKYQVFRTKRVITTVGDRGFSSIEGTINQDTERDFFKISSHMYSVAVMGSYTF